ncbi:PAS domain S-box protein [Methanoregula sp.]|uniref:PAS domain S-box protein n=1 Tax=Methanoregula sp. TaxID=2052170 RepID=UPI002D1C1B62|nr:PAS domain S-box protein [Methanoregula sp.]HVP96778.1 PAS domain S-box protein [Methanoregula sp.]
MKDSRPKKTRKRRSNPLHQHKPLHFLIVENDPSHAELIRRGLLSYDKPYRLTVATTLAGALDLISTDPPDLMILNWILPDGKGEDLLPENPEDLRFPVIVMTGYGDDATSANLMQRGAVDYITKSKAVFDDLPHITERGLQIWKGLEAQRKLERKLSTSESILRAMLNNPIEPIALIDRDGTILDLNTTMANRLGMNPQALIGTCAFSYFTKNVAALRRRYIKRVFETGNAVRFDDERDGMWYDNIFQPVVDPTGKVIQVVVISRDITERKRIEETRRMYEVRLNSAMETGNLAWWEMDLPGGEVRFDDRKAAMLGYSPDRFHHYSDFTALLHPDDLEPTMQAMRDHLSGTLAQYYTEYRIRSADGEYRWLRDVGGITKRHADGTPATVTGIVIDITPGKHAEESLRESEARYRILIEDLPDYVIVHRNGELLYVNNAVLQLLGISKETLLHSNILTYIAPESRDTILNAIEKRDQGRFLPPYVAKLLIPDGSVRWVEIRGSSITFEGKPANLNVLTDVTEKKWAEKAIFESELKFRTLADYTFGWEYWIGTDGEFIYSSPSCEQISGYSPEEFYHKKGLMDQIVFPEDREKVREYFEKISDSGDPEIGTYRLLTKGGVTIWIENVCRSIHSSEGEYIGLRGSIRDITGRKRTEENLQKKQHELETALDKLATTEEEIRYNYDRLVVSQEALKKSETLLNETQHIAKSGGWVYDIATQKVTWTDEVFHIHGVSKDYDPGDPHTNMRFYPPDDQKKIDQAFQELVERGKSYDLELQLDTARGKRIWIRTFGKAERRKGKIVRVFGNIMDISERKRMEKALRDSELKYRELVSHIPFGVGIVTFDGRALTFNDAMCRIFRATPKLLKDTNSVLAYSNPDERAHLFNRLINEGDIKNHEINLKRRDGTSFEASLNLIKFVLNDEPVVFVVIEDITERKKAERVLRESETRFKSLFQNSSDIIRILDKDGKILFESPSSERILGYPQGTLIGKTAINYIHPDDRERVIKEFQMVVDRKNTGVPTEFRIRRADGTYTWVDSIGVNLLGVLGVDGIVITTRQIDKRKEMETTLKESEERYRNIFNLSPVGILISDPKGIVVDVNDALLETFNYTREEILKINCSALYAHPEEREKIVESLLHKGVIRDDEVIYKHNDGSTFPGILNSSRVLRGEKTLFQSTIIDITDRKLMEEEIRSLNRALEQRVVQRTNELRASLEEKEILLREIHHRVKNNLQVIISIIRLQKHQIIDPGTLAVLLDSESRVRSMALVHEKLYRSQDLAHIDIGDYLRTLTQYLFTTYSINQKQVTFHVEITNLELDINRAIPVGLILNELISNSLKHAFPQGREGRIMITGKQEGEGEIVLSIRDDGTGMPAGFDWRHSPSLGMHLVMTLTEQVQGTIDMADSEKGVHFIIRIPGDPGR